MCNTSTKIVLKWHVNGIEWNLQSCYDDINKALRGR
nr:MAG TPA: hypothetical protein [Caudoviricetes sp.]